MAFFPREGTKIFFYSFQFTFFLSLIYEVSSMCGHTLHNKPRGSKKSDRERLLNGDKQKLIRRRMKNVFSCVRTNKKRQRGEEKQSE